MGGSSRARLGVRERKKELVEIGAKMASSEDLDSITLEMVADVADVSRGLVYRYFPGRETFLAAVMERQFDVLLEGTSPPTDVAPKDRLRISMDWYFDYASSHSAQYTAAWRGSTSIHPRVRAVAERNMDAQRERIVSGLQEMGVSGTFVDAVVGGWLKFLVSVTLSWVERGSPPELRPQRLAMDTLTAAIIALPSE